MCLRCHSAKSNLNIQYSVKMKYDHRHAVNITLNYLLPFERSNFDQEFHEEICRILLAYIYIPTGLFLAMVYFGQKLMKDRPAFDLKYVLFAWNMFLSIYSLLGTIRSATEAWEIFKKYGFEGTVCVPLFKNHPFNIWAFFFLYSKFLEYGDTLFLILRKKPIIKLHLLHHSITPWASLYPGLHPMARLMVGSDPKIFIIICFFSFRF